MLIGNYSVLHKSPGRFFGGSTVSVEVQVRSNFGKSGPNRNVQYPGQGTVALRLYARPTGYYPIGAWTIPTTGGDMSSSFGSVGAGSLSSANLAGGLNAVAALAGSGAISSADGTMLLYAAATLSGSGTFSADITGKLDAVASLVGSGNISGAVSAIAQAVAAITGSGNITNANMVSALNATADLVGSGAISSADGSLVAKMIAALAGAGTLSGPIIGNFELAAALAGAGDMSGAILAIGNAVAGLTGAGTLTGGSKAYGEMSADITVTGAGLSTANVAQAVWGALASQMNSPSSMGELLHAAGSAGDPWVTALPGAYAPGSAGYIIGHNIDEPLSGMTAEIWAHIIEGTVTAEQSLRLSNAASAGKTTGLVPGTVGTGALRDLEDTKDRVSVDYDENGNRTSITTDLS